MVRTSAASGHARNLSSSGSGEIERGKGGASTTSAVCATAARIGSRCAALPAYRRLSAAPARAYSARISAESTSVTSPRCQASTIPRGTPPKKTADRRTFVSRMTRLPAASSPFTGLSLPSPSLGYRIRDIAPPHAAALRRSPGLIEQRSEVLLTRRLQHLQDDHVVIAQHDELHPRLETEPIPDLFRNDDLAFGRECGGAGRCHVCSGDLILPVRLALGPATPQGLAQGLTRASSAPRSAS